MQTDYFCAEEVVLFVSTTHLGIYRLKTIFELYPDTYWQPVQ